MVLDHTACYAAVQSRDRRFDGMFYTAVKTTGVYCRPVCPAKTPYVKNCAFYTTPAEAEAAGFRPCLRCRPELSPVSNPAVGNGGLVQRFIAQVQNDGLFGESLESEAARLGVSSRHLRRSVEQECGVSPIEMVRTTRLLFARRLLSTTAMPVSDVAFGSGFGSLARFNSTFRAQYDMTPSDFRSRTGRTAGSHAAVRLTLACREPLAWRAMLEYLAVRCVPGVEAVEEGRYWRTLRIGDRRGWLSAGRSPGGIEVEVSDDLATHLLAIAGRVRNLFDLDTNPAPIHEALRRDPSLKAAVDGEPGLRVPGSCDGFELAVRAILGQQVTVRAATTLAGRVVRRFAEPAAGLPARLTHWPFTAAGIAAASLDDIASCGIPGARARTIQMLAAEVAGGRIDLQRATASATALERLAQIPGIGPWTRDYIAMRALRWPDAFPSGDLGLRKAAGGGTPIAAKLLEKRSEEWRPWRPYAAVYLWSLCRQQENGIK